MMASFENGAAGVFPYLMETPGDAFAQDQSLCGNKKRRKPDSTVVPKRIYEKKGQ
jgi:hypothetical protein